MPHLCDCGFGTGWRPVSQLTNAIIHACLGLGKLFLFYFGAFFGACPARGEIRFCAFFRAAMSGIMGAGGAALRARTMDER